MVSFVAGIFIGLSSGLLIGIIFVLSYGHYIRKRNLKKDYLVKCREYGPGGLLLDEFNKVVTSCMSPQEAADVIYALMANYIPPSHIFTIQDINELKEREVI